MSKDLIMPWHFFIVGKFIYNSAQASFAKVTLCKAVRYIKTNIQCIVKCRNELTETCSYLTRQWSRRRNKYHVILTWNTENVCLEDFGDFKYTDRYYKQYFVVTKFDWKNVSRYVVMLVRYCVGTCRWIKCNVVGCLVRRMDGWMNKGMSGCTFECARIRKWTVGLIY